MSKLGKETFWDIQELWTRVKDSPLVQRHEDVVAATGASRDAEDLRGEELLKLLAFRGSFDSYELSKELGKDHQQVVGTIKSLQSLGEVRFNSNGR